jgi:hypothetical protein
MGIGLLIWALAPAMLERLITGHRPHSSTLLQGVSTFVCGALYFAYVAALRRRVYWVLWAAFLNSVILAAFAVALTMFEVTAVSAFLLIFAGVTVLMTWLAMVAHQRSAAGAIADPSPDSRPKR